MNLIDLDPERVSLELGERELPMVLRRLRKFGRISRTEYATCDMLLVGAEPFVLIDDFGELAVISTTAAGDAILRDALSPRRRLTSTERRRQFRWRVEAGRLAA